MYKLLLVDDEQDILRGMANSIPWSDWGFNIVGQESNGLDAIKSIEEQIPHIVLSDIRMPKMDGIELMKYLNEHYPEIKIIILSGYNDVEYLNASIKNGVTEYLLKPTDLDEFEILFKKMKIRLDKEKKKREEYEYLKQSFIENREYEVNRLLCNLLKGYYEEGYETRLYELEGETGLNLSQCVVIVFDVQKEEFQNEREELTQFYLLKNQIVEYCNLREEKLSVQFFLNAEEKLLGIISIKSTVLKEWQSFIVKYMQELQTEIYDIYTLELSVGISSLCEKITFLPECYEQAITSVHQKIFLGPFSIVVYPELQQFSKDEYYTNTLDIEKVRQYIVTGEIQLLQEVFDEIMNTFSNKMLEDYHYIDRMFMECLYHISRWAFDYYQIRLELLMTEQKLKYNDFYKYRSLQKKMDYMRKTVSLLSVAVQENKRNGKKTKNLAQIIMDYIEQEYCNNLISLDYIAEKVQKNAAYISKVFKKETGYNFSDFITKKRVEKSKRLLENYSIKVYEVAEQVGYADVSNFIKVFKKSCGMSPNEYRRK